jgi:aminoglycoside phosphotransferase (APT) family kinase protein
MRKLALVHGVDWKNLELDTVLCTAPDLEQSAAHYIDSIVELFEQQRMEPIPIFLEAVEWLKEHAPPASQICLCKGTNGLGEEIFVDEQIVAMSDWEEAHIGDPSADFAFMQEFAPTVVRDGETVWSLAHAIEYYRSVGGAAVTVAAVQYYQIVRALRMMAFSHRAGVSAHRSAHAPIRQAWTGVEVHHFCKQILAYAMGMAPPPDPNYLAELNTSVENAP